MDWKEREDHQVKYDFWLKIELNLLQFIWNYVIEFWTFFFRSIIWIGPQGLRGLDGLFGQKGDRGFPGEIGEIGPVVKGEKGKNSL